MGLASETSALSVDAACGHRTCSATGVSEGTGYPRGSFGATLLAFCCREESWSSDFLVPNLNRAPLGMEGDRWAFFFFFAGASPRPAVLACWRAYGIHGDRLVQPLLRFVAEGRTGAVTLPRQTLPRPID